MTVAQDHQDSQTPSLLLFRRTNCKAAHITQEGCQGGHLQPGSDSEEHLVGMQIERQFAACTSTGDEIAMASAHR